MKIEITKIVLSAYLAISNGLELESETSLEELIEDIAGNFNPVDDITGAHDAVQDAINGVIDGACYRDAYIPHS